MEFSPDKKKRQRKSTSAIVELNGQENISDQQVEIKIEPLKRMVRQRTASKKENIDINALKKEDQKTANGAAKNTTERDAKLEPISVNTLSDKRRKSMPVTTQSAAQSKNNQNGSKSAQSNEDNGSTKPAPSKKKAVKKTDETVEEKKSNVSDSSDSELDIEDEKEILKSLDLEFNKLQSGTQIKTKENVCVVCEMSGAEVECAGFCKSTYHSDCIGNFDAGYKCEECTTGKHTCFVCSKTLTDSGDTSKKCAHTKCGRFFHDECAKNNDRFRQETTTISKVSSYICPTHTCLTCWLDSQADLVDEKQPHKGRFVSCIRCPNTYHIGDFCIPAGSITLDCMNIICADHFKPIAKLKIHNTVNVTWCFICCDNSGDLVNCTTCPSSFHMKCVTESENADRSVNNDKEASGAEVANQEAEGTVAESGHNSSDIKNEDTMSNWRCTDCKNGKRPLYGDIVWAKVGSYRWWPAQICHPRHLPPRMINKPYQVGEFPVRFFGTHDYYWVALGRCFLFAVGDEMQRGNTSGKSLGAAYNDGVIDAIVGFREIRRLKSLKYAKSKNGSAKNVKQPFVYIKSNRPVGNVKINRIPASELPYCDCDQKSADPCGSNDCLNVALKYECHPSSCPAGSRCLNQRFVKRLYPKQTPVRTSDGRGWGLIAHSDIKKGTFVNEYVGELIDDEECKRRLDWAHDNNVSNFYLMTIEKDRVIDAGPKGNLARYMNHSCDPNCETQRWVVNGDVRIGLFALVDIPANTELTFNYNFNCVGNAEKVACRCGAKNCSGFLGARPKQLNELKSTKSVSNLNNSDMASNSKKRKQSSKARNSLDTDDLPNPKKTKLQVKGRSKSTTMPLSLDTIRIASKDKKIESVENSSITSSSSKNSAASSKRRSKSRARD